MSTGRFDDSAWREACEFSLRRARRLAPAAEAEDVSQEALLRAWRNVANLHQDSSFEAWLGTIVANEASRNHQRSRPTLPLVDIDEAVEDPHLNEVESRADVERAMAVLDGHDQLIVRLRYERDLTQHAIAELLEMPEGTVKVRLHRARGKIRQALSSS